MWYMSGVVTDEDMNELLEMRQELDDRQDKLHGREAEFIQRIKDTGGNLTSTQANYLRYIHDRSF